MVKAAIVCVLAALAGILAYHYWPGDERALRKQLAALEELGSKEAAEQPVNSLWRAAQIAGQFDDPCMLSVEEAGYDRAFSRQHIQERIAMVRASFSMLTVTLHDIAIRFPEQDQAVVILTLRLRGMQHGEEFADVREVEATLRKQEGQWLFTSVRLVAVLQK